MLFTIAKIQNREGSIIQKKKKKKMQSSYVEYTNLIILVLLEL